MNNIIISITFIKVMDCFKDDKTAGLFLEINPNIDEIAKENEELNEEADIEEKKSVIKEEKYDHDDVFEEHKAKPKPKPKPTKPKPKPKPKTYTQEITNEIIEEEQGEQDTKPELPMTYRERKKIEKEKKKAEERRLKEIEKQKRREETAERNRQRARERYWREKQAKKDNKIEQEKEIPKKIVDETKSKLNSFQKRDLNTKLSKSNDIDFATFTTYMLKYEDLKHQFNKQKEREHEEKQRREQPKETKSVFPANYPLHLLYGTSKKKNRNNFF